VTEGLSHGWEVISWKTTRRSDESSSSAACTRCQAMASPSRSGSVARKTASARWAASWMSFHYLALLLGHRVVRFEPVPDIDPQADLGRSRTWPTEALTSKDRPRILAMVLAFAGDSTTTRLRPPLLLAPARRAGRLRLATDITLRRRRRLRGPARSSWSPSGAPGLQLQHG